MKGKTRKKDKLVLGVGINDAGYPVRWFVDGKQFICPFYSKWSNMLKRCYSKSSQKADPSYLGCEVCEEWKRFSNFKDWLELQGHVDYHLDKDLIGSGKLYNPTNCVLVPPLLNQFLVQSGKARGKHPLGAHYQKGAYVAACSNPDTGKSDHLGRFQTAEEAHEAWRKRKHELALMYADLQTDERVKQALSVKYSKEVWYKT